MARGWESKGIEEQQAEHNSSASEQKHSRNPAEIAISRQRDDLKLSRRHVLQQLEVVQNARHRQLLQDALSFLDKQLSALEQAP